MDDLRHRRPSTPPREGYRRSSSESRRIEDQRRADEQRHGNEGYHPSEAAHHQAPPTHLPPIQQGPQPMQGIIHDGPSQPPAVPAPSTDEHPTSASRAAAPPSALNEPERAARKVDVNENYDDEEEEDKKGLSTNGSGTEAKSGTPTNSGVNGVMGPTPKVESS